MHRPVVILMHRPVPDICLVREHLRLADDASGFGVQLCHLANAIYFVGILGFFRWFLLLIPKRLELSSISWADLEDVYLTTSLASYLDSEFLLLLLFFRKNNLIWNLMV